MEVYLSRKIYLPISVLLVVQVRQIEKVYTLLASKMELRNLRNIFTLLLVDQDHLAQC